jgi:hypothetical protein
MSKLFEKKYVDYLTIYKVPISPDQLDPTVFYHSEIGQEPKLQQGIHSQVINDLEQFAGDQPQRIKNCYLVGPATRPGSKQRTGDLRVIIVLNKNMMDADIDGLLAEEVMKLAKALSGRLAVGTGRKIVYIPTVRPVESSDYEDGIYDISKFCWLKLPTGLK